MKYKRFSQLGQDLWVAAMHGPTSTGFFVEIGAADGVQINNTLLLEEELGWAGVCVEPNPSLFKDLKANRRAICVQKAVYPGVPRILDFVAAGLYGALSEVAGRDMHADLRHADAKEHGIIAVETISIGELLGSCGAPAIIHYVSIDVEGGELEILQDFDFSTNSVALLTIEHNYDELRRQSILDILAAQGFRRIRAQFDDWYYNPDVLSRLYPDRPVSHYELVSRVAETLHDDQVALAAEWRELHEQHVQDSDKRLERIQELDEIVANINVDREARLRSIVDLQERLQASETDREARLRSILDLQERLQASETDREARLKTIQDLDKRLQASEADRAARLEIINELHDRLSIAEGRAL